jgi:hypothetical protein
MDVNPYNPLDKLNPGAGRYQQARSRWDTLHPGRAWALKCVERQETPRQIERELLSFLKSMPDLAAR